MGFPIFWENFKVDMYPLLHASSSMNVISHLNNNLFLRYKICDKKAKDELRPNDLKAIPIHSQHSPIFIGQPVSKLSDIYRITKHTSNGCSTKTRHFELHALETFHIRFFSLRPLSRNETPTWFLDYCITHL